MVVPTINPSQRSGGWGRRNWEFKTERHCLHEPKIKKEKRCGSVINSLPNICQALGLISPTYSIKEVSKRLEIKRLGNEKKFTIYLTNKGITSTHKNLL